MKKIFTLVLTAMSAITFAQGTFNMGKNFKGREGSAAEIDAKMHQRMTATSSNKMAAVGTTAYISYYALDKAYQEGFLGATFSAYVWDMNWNYTNLDSNLRKVTLAIDTMVDALTNETFTADGALLDSVYLVYGKVNNSGTDDTLEIRIVNLYNGTSATANTSFPLTQPTYTASVAPILKTIKLTGSTDFPSTPGWYGSTGGVSNLAVLPIEINYTMTGKKHIGIEFIYHGDKINGDTMGIHVGYGYLPYTCPSGLTKLSQRTGYPSGGPFKANTYSYNSQYNPYPANSYTVNYGYLPQLSANYTTGAGFLYQDCDGVSGYIAGTDGVSFLQNLNATVVISSATLGNKELRETGVNLSQNVPNPFNGTTLINYELNERAMVKMNVYDITGKMIMQINDGQQISGKHTMKVDGSKLASGVYYYSLTAGDKTSAVKKMIIAE